MKVVEFILNRNVIGKAEATNMKQAKREAFEIANAELEKEAIIIRLNPKADQISISKEKDSISAVVEKQETTSQDVYSIPEDKAGTSLQHIDANNIGFKMMQKLGWSGGGLGTKKDGIAEPISLDFGQNTRHGLGAKPSIIGANGLNKEYCRQLVTDYCNSDEIRDLKFTSAFTKDQRGYFHT